jgi:hypothetical protein
LIINENNYIATLDMSYNKDQWCSRAKLGIKTPSGSLRGNDQRAIYLDTDVMLTS